MGQRVAFGPFEVGVRADAGGVPQRQEDRGDRVRRGGALGAEDPVAVDLDASDFQGVTEFGRVGDVDLKEDDVRCAGDRVVVALCASLSAYSAPSPPGDGWR